MILRLETEGLVHQVEQPIDAGSLATPWSLPALAPPQYRVRPYASRPRRRGDRVRRRANHYAAKTLRLPQRQVAPNQRHPARRTHAALPSLKARLRCVSDQSEVLYHGRCAQDTARPPRGRPRCRTAEDEDKGVCQIARRTKAHRDALRALKNSPRLRADAAQGTFRPALRVPSRRHRAEPQNARATDSWAATHPTARIIGLRSPRSRTPVLADC